MGSKQEVLYMASGAIGMDPMLVPGDQDLLEIAQELIQGELNPSQNPIMMSNNSQQAQARAQPIHMQQQIAEPWVEITEQPKSRGLRFRYECEGRSAGSIPGEHSTTENRTYPTIKIHTNKVTDAIVVVSCVTKEQPAKPHPHSLVGKDCNRGVCTVRLRKTNVTSFPNLGIQCAKKRDVPKALQDRQNLRVDPFNTGLPKDANSIDLSTVKLCFQVFLPDENGKFTRILQPVVSQPIYDKKTVNDLVIVRVSKHSGSCRGGDEVFLLCEKVNKEDIEVRFYEETPEGVAWESRGEFGQNDVHRQFAIVFKTPAYKRQDITGPVTVFMQLRRTSDGETSEATPFQYTPENPDPEGIESKRKRKRVPFDNFIMDTAGLPGAKSDGKTQLREKLRSKNRLVGKVKVEKDDDYVNAGMMPTNPSVDPMTGLLRRPPTATVTGSFAPATSPGQPSYTLPQGPPSASQGTPGMPTPMAYSHVTMSTDVAGGPATFTTLNNVTNPPQHQHAHIKSEHSESLLSELAENESTCNSLNLDSGLLNYITDEQADSLTKFLNQEGMLDNGSAGAGSMQQDLMNTDMAVPMSDNLQDIHQQLNNLNQ